MNVDVVIPALFVLVGTFATSFTGRWVRASWHGLRRRRIHSALGYACIAAASPALVLIGMGSMYDAANGDAWDRAGAGVAAVAIVLAVALLRVAAHNRGRRPQPTPSV